MSQTHLIARVLGNPPRKMRGSSIMVCSSGRWANWAAVSVPSNPACSEPRLYRASGRGACATPLSLLHTANVQKASMSCSVSRRRDTPAWWPDLPPLPRAQGSAAVLAGVLLSSHLRSARVASRHPLHIIYQIHLPRGWRAIRAPSWMRIRLAVILGMLDAHRDGRLSSDETVQREQAVARSECRACYAAGERSRQRLLAV